MWNLGTGQRITWTARPTANDVFCDPVLCVGRTTTGDGDRQFMQRPDGSDYQEFPYQESSRYPVAPVLGGRFGLGRANLPDGSVPFVWDRFTGKAAIVTTNESNASVQGTPRGSTTLHGTEVWGMDAASPDGGVVQWSDGNGGFYLLDLKAIR